MKFIAIWGATILAYDTVASAGSKIFGIDYVWFGIGSAVILLAAAYVAAPRFGLRKTVLAVSTVAAVEGSLGWGVSWWIGPGQVVEPGITLPVLVGAGLLGAIVFGGLLGSVGGYLGLRGQRRVTLQP